MIRRLAPLCLCFALSLGSVAPSSAQDSGAILPDLSTFSTTAFSLADYTRMKLDNPENAQLILQAMREAVFYAQASVGRPVLCASPVPVPGARIMAMVDEEIAMPSNMGKRVYEPGDHIAFILMHALRRHELCE